MEDYANALNDFKKVTYESLKAEKHNQVGVCYYRLGLHEEAEREYWDAIRNKSTLVEAYYNLAVLYCAENKYERSVKILKNCSKINRNFHNAKEALIKLQGAGRYDWFDWWFKNTRIKKRLGIVISLLMFSSVVSVILTALYGQNHPELLGIAAIMFILLIFPNLKTIKIQGIELETIQSNVGIVVLEPVMVNPPYQLLKSKLNSPTD